MNLLQLSTDLEETIYIKRKQSASVFTWGRCFSYNKKYYDYLRAGPLKVIGVFRIRPPLYVHVNR